MGTHVRHSHPQRVMFALRHPEMAWRWIRRQDMIEISPAEIAPYLPADPVILEAGACDGVDTVRFAAQWPDAVIHAFEPVPALQAEVRLRTTHLPQVHFYPLALAGSAGEAVMYVVDPGAGMKRGSSSLLARQEREPNYDIRVCTETIAGWAAANAVDRIDLMWLDMEGGELAALKAAGPILDTVKAVSMEVTREESDAGVPRYEEVVAWMGSQGFRIAIDRVTLWFGNILFVRA